MIDLPPDTTLPVIRSHYTPDPAEGCDPYFAEQWGLQRIHAPAAWALAVELNPEAKPPLVAIIDSHLTPPQPHAADLNIVALWNVALGVPYHNANPACYHSSHVTSIAGSITGNGQGMAGVSNGPPIYGLQVLTGCFGQQVVCAFGINKAVEVGARVVNMSLQYGDTPEPSMQNAASNAAAAGVLLIAASGNYSWNDRIAVPAMLPEVVGVGAINDRDERAHWSNAGDDLELVAPGVDVLGLGATNYELWSGTSMAAPHVTGTAALLMSVYPKLTAAEVRAMMNATADDLGPPGRDPEYGYGCVNAYRALHAAAPCYADFDRDGSLTAADYAAFQNAFVEGLYRADCNADERWTVADFGCFQSKHAGGC